MIYNYNYTIGKSVSEIQGRSNHKSEQELEVFVSLAPKRRECADTIRL